MFDFVDDFLNKITMYRLLLYYLLALLLAAIGLSIAGVLPYSAWDILLSTSVITGTSLVANAIFASVYEAVPNVESVYLTALILALIITPSTSPTSIGLMFWAAVLSTASKYVLAFRKKHFFNPAAIAVVITALVLGQSASWWVGVSSLLPIVAIGGILIVRKIHRSELVWSFLITAVVTALLGTFLGGGNTSLTIKQMLLDSPIFFFAFVMLTEPLTTPPTKSMQIAYGALTGFLFGPQIHLGALYTTPELALITSNVFSYIVSPKMKSILTLRQIKKVANNTYDYVFSSDTPIRFRPGQYLEWTLPVSPADNRGNRRWFTVASSPTEKELRLGVKFYPRASRFKQVMAKMGVGDKIMAGALAGNFVLSSNPNEKSVFIAGGIGITPFRSIARYLTDTGQKRDIVMFYSNNLADEIAYKEVFDQASTVGLKTVYTLTDTAKITGDWHGETGFVNEQMIKKYLPDFTQRRFYVSGPRSMVVTFKETLKKMGVKSSNIVIDYFPGFA